jgi:hypothetical protein
MNSSISFEQRTGQCDFSTSTGRRMDYMYTSQAEDCLSLVPCVFNARLPYFECKISVLRINRKNID